MSSITEGIVKAVFSGSGEPNTPKKENSTDAEYNEEEEKTEQPTPEQQTSEGLKPPGRTEVLHEVVAKANGEQPTEEQPTEEQPTEEQPTEEQPTEEQQTTSADSVDILDVANGTTNNEESSDKTENSDIEYENVPVAIREQEKAIVKLAAQIVANQEAEKNLAILSETLANMPPALFPKATEIVASTLIDAKDSNGNRIWDDKNEIIKMLKKLNNAKNKKQPSKTGRGGGKRGGKKAGKKPRENDYLDYMMTKRINPAILITPRMK